MSISGLSGVSNLLALFGNNSSSSSSSSNSSSSSTSSSSGSTSSNSNLPATAQFDLENIQKTQNSIDAFNSFSSTLSSVQNALLGVLTNAFTTAASGITSSNNNVAYIAPSASTNYAVDVTQLAQVQQIETNLPNTSDQTSYGPSGTAPVYNTGTLSIQLGAIDTSTGTFTPNTSSPITVNVTNGSLSGVAAAINAANAGVGASIVKDSNGNYQLKLTGGTTGAANGFQIVGTDNPSGQSNASLAGLDYTAANTGGANQTNYGNSTAPIQQAQDAAYSVNGQQYGAPTNLNVPVAPGVNINLLTTGSTVLSQPSAPTGITAAANSLVSTINGALQVVQQYASGPLSSNPTILQEFQNDVTLAVNTTYGTGSTELLSQIGITVQPDGTYAVNTTQLATQYATDPNGTQNLLSQVASALMQVTQTYTGQYGSVTNEITQLQNTQQIYYGQYQIDSQVSSSSNAQAASAVQAYNLLSLANGGSVSPYTNSV